VSNNPADWDRMHKLGVKLLGYASAHPDNIAAVALDKLEQAEAGARALWAVRVLDAHDDLTGKQTRWEPFSRVVPITGEICPNNGIRYSGTRDSARLAAAEAVFPELPDAARAKLGEKP